MPASNPALTEQAAATLIDAGERLRQQRRSLKISATAAAEAAGISRVTLHRIERGEASVTAGAYAAAAGALGMRWQLSTPTEANPAADRKGWIPARVRIADYPVLKELAWQVHGTDVLTPREALDIYERNWRHVDAARLTPDEQELVEALRDGLTGVHAV